MKGLLKGTEAARLWATRKRGGVQQTIELEQLYEGGGIEGGGGRAVALIMRRWHWDDDDGEFAGEDEMAWIFELHEHRIRVLAADGGPRRGPPRHRLRPRLDGLGNLSLWPMPRRKSP